MPTILLTGDLMPTRPFLRDALAPAAAGLWDLCRRADLVFANLECPLTTRVQPADKHVAFGSDPALAHELAAAGVDVVTLANNHMVDQGLDGLFDTLEALRAVSLPAVGAGATLEAALAPAVLDADGLRVAFVGLASTLAVGSAAAPNRPGLAPVRVTTSYVVDATALEETPGIAPVVETRAWPGDVEAATAAVARARQAADFCVVGVHWGVPHGWVAQFQDPLATYQRPLARALVEAGADVVVGHHPHVLHGIEVVRGRPVFYSLGNFLFHTLRLGAQPVLARPDPPYSWRSLRGPVNFDSAVALVHADRGGPVEVELVPVRLDERGDPHLAEGDDASRILASLAEQSAPLGVSLAVEAGRARLSLRAAGVPGGS